MSVTDWPEWTRAIEECDTRKIIPHHILNELMTRDTLRSYDNTITLEDPVKVDDLLPRLLKTKSHDFLNLREQSKSFNKYLDDLISNQLGVPIDNIYSRTEIKKPRLVLLIEVLQPGLTNNLIDNEKPNPPLKQVLEDEDKFYWGREVKIIFST